MWWLLWRIVYASLTAWTLSSIYNFLRHLAAARTTKLPYVCLPIFELNPFWQLSKRWHRPIIERLPFGLSESSWLRLWYMDWRFVAKYKFHERLGDVFLVVAPGCLMAEIADADSAADMVGRSKTDFVKPTWLYTPVNVFGLNIITADGATWRRHRKVVAPQYNDAIHGRVWKEALGLAQGLVFGWTSGPGVDSWVVQNASPDLTSLALRVIAAVGFGIPIPFQKTDDSVVSRADETPANADAMKLDPGRVSRFPNALEYMVTNFMKVLVIPPWLLKIGPRDWQRLHRSFNDVDVLLQEILEVQVQKQKLAKANGTSGTTSANSILAELVKNAGTLEGHAHGPEEHAATLSKDEVLGNTFILALAGSRTTADSLHFSLILLAMHPEIQDWLIQDVDAALASEPEDPSQWKYETLFPNLIAPPLRHGEYPPESK
ncbi:hypothetical protein PG999_000166 [Apiospora kogelbergensis]|uniref:Cytochrome P450 n=1 Tax=Apiospora kogelbergensis TaxID=1337665 RepID=A0AAW0RB13_9PEZI